MAKKVVKSKAPAWAAPLDKHVKAYGRSWTKIAETLRRTEGGIRHWRNGTRPIGLQEFIDLCGAAGADPYTILHEVYPTETSEEQLSAKQQILLHFFAGLTPEQQGELIQKARATYDANRYIQAHLPVKLRTFSNAEVRAAVGDIPSPLKAVKRTGK